MGSIDLYESEVGYVELALKEKDRLQREAAKLLKEAEDLDEQLVVQICQTHKQKTIGAQVRITRGENGRPARLVWKEPKAQGGELDGVTTDPSAVRSP